MLPFDAELRRFDKGEDENDQGTADNGPERGRDKKEFKNNRLDILLSDMSHGNGGRGAPE